MRLGRGAQHGPLPLSSHAAGWPPQRTAVIPRASWHVAVPVRNRRAFAAAFLGGSACAAPSETRGRARCTSAEPISIVVRHPVRGAFSPADFDYVSGTVSVPDATVIVNGVVAAVHPHGTFIAYARRRHAPVAYHVEARCGQSRSEVLVPFGVRPRDPPPAVRTFSAQWVELRPSGVAKQAVLGRLGPGAPFTWQFLPGTRVPAVVAIGGETGVRIDARTVVLVPSGDVRAAGKATTVQLRWRGLHRYPERVEAILDASRPPVYRTVADARGVHVYFPGAQLLGGASASATVPALPGSGLRAVRVGLHEADSGVGLTLDLGSAPAGHRVKFHGGQLRVGIRRSLEARASGTLTGIRVVLDPGHPPAGAVGPGGLREVDVVLDIARRTAGHLRALGAQVTLTRADTNPLALDLRQRIAVRENANAFVSLHLDGVPDGRDPSLFDVATVFAHHRHSLPLAAHLRDALHGVEGRPARPVQFGDYAVLRDAWVPSVLCELATLTLPHTEAALRDGRTRETYAAAVTRGLQAYFMSLAFDSSGTVMSRVGRPVSQ
jgi:N-acetylmuramoyl-L-alanine amidase